MNDDDNQTRANLARWVVAMRTAREQSVSQGNGYLNANGSYCCLGLWCEVLVGLGVLERHDPFESLVHYGAPGLADVGATKVLPSAAHFAEADGPAASTDPGVLHLYGEEDRDGNDLVITAAQANDDHRLNFAQIADCVVWTYEITETELAAASAAQAQQIAAGTHRW